MDYYLFIISSLNHPIYREIHRQRKGQLRKHKVRYSVLMNEQSSPLEDTSIPTEHPMSEDEIFYPMGGYNPGMTQKFLYAVKMFFRSFPSYDKIPNYIVRINATVFIDFKGLENILKQLPKKRVLAGPCWTSVDSAGCDSFFVGMLIIFSKDVLWNILKDPRMNEKEILSKNDDVALSILAGPHSEKYNLMKHFVYPGNEPYNMESINPHENQKYFFRIWSGEPNRNLDKTNFKILKNFFEGDEKKTNTPPPLPNDIKEPIILGVKNKYFKIASILYFGLILSISIMLFFFYKKNFLRNVLRRKKKKIKPIG